MNLFESAEYAESLSECKKKRVGASLAINSTVVSLGFNHAEHSCHCDMNAENPNIEHAEIHCLKNYEFIGNEYSEMAVTYICCLNCAKYIVGKGVKVVYYRDHRTEPQKQQGIKFLLENGVIVRNEWSV